MPCAILSGFSGPAGALPAACECLCAVFQGCRLPPSSRTAAHTGARHAASLSGGLMHLSKPLGPGLTPVVCMPARPAGPANTPSDSEAALWCCPNRWDTGPAGRVPCAEVCGRQCMRQPRPVSTATTCRAPAHQAALTHCPVAAACRGKHMLHGSSHRQCAVCCPFGLSDIADTVMSAILHEQVLGPLHSRGQLQAAHSALQQIDYSVSPLPPAIFVLHCTCTRGPSCHDVLGAVESAIN